jgi:hypothetical protein
MPRRGETPDGSALAAGSGNWSIYSTEKIADNF